MTETLLGALATENKLENAVPSSTARLTLFIELSSFQRHGKDHRFLSLFGPLSSPLFFIAFDS
jgi:hypothetical protein